MQITVKLSDFAQALNAAARVAARAAATPAVTGVLLKAAEGRLWLEATDLEVSLSRAVPADVEEPGSAVVPARVFADMAKRLDAEKVRLAASGGRLEVGYGSGAARFSTYPAEDFPAFPELPAEAVPFYLTREALEEVVDRVAPVAGDAPPFCGVLFEAAEGRVTFVATDTHRLAFAAGPELEGASFRALVPVRALEAAAAAKGYLYEVRLAPQAASFKSEDLSVHTRLIAVSFPRWQAVLPGGFEATVAVEAKSLIAALDRALLVARQAGKERANIVRLEFGPEGLTVRANSEAGSCQEALEARVEGEAGGAYFNGTYLVDALRALSGGKAVLHFGPELKTLVVRGEGEADHGYGCLILPIVVREAAAA